MTAGRKIAFATTPWRKVGAALVLQFDGFTARASRGADGCFIVRVSNESGSVSFTVGPFRDAAHAQRIGRHVLWSAINDYTPDNGKQPMRAPRLRDFRMGTLCAVWASTPLAEEPVGRKAKAGGEP